MKAMNSSRLILMAFALLLISASCSTPPYKQNKYKSAKRSRDCGCYNKAKDTNKTMLSLNDAR
ncbi:MAG: hypothetical protein IPN08_00185 [Bacteroidales bacterium]|nr:hypothetical protein [Bacteroidales bacterium]